MTTTTSVTGTAAATPAAGTTASVTSTAAQSLLSSLGSGSGVDTAGLVTSLVGAQFAAQDAALSTRADALTAQVSAVATVKSAITGFSSALSALVKGGTLAAQPVSSQPAALGVAAQPGAALAGLSASVAVTRLAAGQVAVSRQGVASRTAALGTGQLTLTLGTAAYAADGASMTGFTAGPAAPITIDVTDADDSLDGIAAAITAAGAAAGVSASVVTDADGTAYLSLKGATGAAQAFTLEATRDDAGALAQFAVGPGAGGTALTGQAQNARLTVDGIAVERATNTVSDLVPGVKLTLAAVTAGAARLGATTPTDALAGAVGDVVDTYNQVIGVLKAQTDPVTGSLRGDPAAAALLRRLGGLTLADLTGGAGGGGVTSLAGLGVATNKDGTLTLDAARLNKVLATTPQAVAAMFADPGATGTAGLAALLSGIAAAASDTTYGLGASAAGYARAQADVAAQQATVSSSKAVMTTRLTGQFASMQAIVSRYKSTQAFLTNQIAAWNKSQ